MDFEFEYSMSDLYTDEEILEADARGELDINCIQIQSNSIPVVIAPKHLVTSLTLEHFKTELKELSSFKFDI